MKTRSKIQIVQSDHVLCIGLLKGCRLAIEALFEDVGSKLCGEAFPDDNATMEELVYFLDRNGLVNLAAALRDSYNAYLES